MDFKKFYLKKGGILIWVECLEGPFKNETREIYLELMDPIDFFRQMVNHGWRWEVNYSQATEIEKFEFFRGELVARIVRALKNNLPVKFLGQSYQVKKKQDWIEVAQKIEDVIVSSGRIITIDSDDEQGFVIGVCGFEN